MFNFIIVSECSAMITTAVEICSNVVHTVAIYHIHRLQSCDLTYIGVQNIHGVHSSVALSSTVDDGLITRCRVQV